VCVEKCYLL